MLLTENSVKFTSVNVRKLQNIFEETFLVLIGATLVYGPGEIGQESWRVSISQLVPGSIIVEIGRSYQETGMVHQMALRLKPSDNSYRQNE
jgi:hypothetical protein